MTDTLSANKETVTETVGPEVFQASAAPTLGIELELAVLDRDSGELVPGAPRILHECEHAGIPDVGSELMQSMIEVRTGICHTIAEARDDLSDRLRKVRNIASSLGYQIAMMGTHPSLNPSTSSLTDNPRYHQQRVRLAWLIYQRVAFGLHIHVGVPGGKEAIAVTNLTIPYLPHLLALSSNSPFWQGVDTGLASCRAPLYGLVPHSGVPGVFSDWDDFIEYFALLNKAGAYESIKSIKTDIRPRPDLGTLEFRICDMPDSLNAVFALAALTRALVIWALQLLQNKPQLRHADRRRQWITTQNKWLAARHGLKAPHIRTLSGKPRILADEIRALIDRVDSATDPFGDRPFLKHWQSLDHLESGAARQRRLYREHGSWQFIVRDMVERLDRSLKV